MQKLTFFERQVIESGLRARKSVRAIAMSLARDHRVIQREIGRNKSPHLPYSAQTAQRLAERREAKRHTPKLEQAHYQRVREYIVEHLREDLSPEQIAGLLEHQPMAELEGKRVCLETIYQYIYTGEGRWEQLYQHLRRGRKKRQQRWARTPRKTPIPERVSIHQRPAEVNERLTLGHWESDTVEGKRTTKGNLSVQYERKLQLARLHWVSDKTALETLGAIRASVDSLPQDIWKTMTFDNGTETVRHTELRTDYGMETYHCDAYAAWQKGGVENLNGLIRQYIPKGTDISKLTDEDIYAIQERLNNRPRKTLGYLTPNQALAQEVGH